MNEEDSVNLFARSVQMLHSVSKDLATLEIVGDGEEKESSSNSSSTTVGVSSNNETKSNIDRQIYDPATPEMLVGAYLSVHYKELGVLGALGYKATVFKYVPAINTNESFNTDAKPDEDPLSKIGVPGERTTCKKAVRATGHYILHYEDGDVKSYSAVTTPNKPNELTLTRINGFHDMCQAVILSWTSTQKQNVSAVLASVHPKTFDSSKPIDFIGAVVDVNFLSKDKKSILCRGKVVAYDSTATQFLIQYDEDQEKRKYRLKAQG